MAHYVIFIEFIKVTWRKHVTSYVKTGQLSQKRNSIRNVLNPTRSFGHFRFKSYGPLSDFHKSGDLDLPFIRFSKKKIVQGPWSRRHILSKKSGRSDNRCGLYIAKRQTYRQTDKQTNRGDQYTLRKSEISQSNKRHWPIYFAKTLRVSQSNENRSESGYFAKPLSFYCVINLYCDKSRSNVKGQRSRA